MNKVYNRLTCVHFALFVYDRISDATTHLWKWVRNNRIICKAARDNIYASKELPYFYHIYFSDIYLMLTATDVSMSPLCLLVRYEKHAKWNR